MPPPVTLSLVRRIKTPRNLVCVTLSSWDVSPATTVQSRKGGRPKRVDGWGKP